MEPERHFLGIGVVVLVVVAAAGGFLALIYHGSPTWGEKTPTAPVTAAAAHPEPGSFGFAPPPPEAAPQPLHDAVMQGYDIMMGRATAPKISGNALSCRNCHFEGGRIRDTISLVGAAAAPPLPRSLSGPATVQDWIELCVTTSLNGPPLAPGSPPMRTLVAYLQWISQGVPVGAVVPWLGLADLKPDVPPDAENGQKVLSGACTPCHGATGEGGNIAPPVLGSGSWSSASPIATPGKLGAFIYRFMPLGKHDLTPGQAADVAAFLLASPRPTGPATGPGPGEGPP